jgi:hypothetical protein
VVGRGLRRRVYAANDDGYFDPEYAEFYVLNPRSGNPVFDFSHFLLLLRTRRSAQWIAVLLVATAIVAIFKHGDLWNSFTPGGRYGSGPQISTLSATIGLIIGALVAAAAFILSRRGTLPGIVVGILTVLTMVCLLVSTQLVDYYWPPFSLQSPLLVSLLVCAVTIVLLPVANVAAQSQAKTVHPSQAVTSVAAFAREPGHRPVKALFYGLPLLAFASATWSGATDAEPIFSWPVNIPDFIFGAWALWALAVVPPWSRVLVIVVLASAAIGDIGYSTSSLVVPTSSFVVASAAVYMVMCCLVIRGDWKVRPLTLVDGDPLTRYLKLQAAALKRELAAKEARDHTLAAAKRSLLGIGLVAIFTVFVALANRDQLWSLLRYNASALPVPAKLPKIEVRNFTPLLGGLSTTAGIVASTPRLLSRVIVIALSTLTTLLLLADSQVIVAAWRTWTVVFWLVVAATSIALALVFLGIVSILEGPAPGDATGQVVGHDRIEDRIWNTVITVIDPRKLRAVGFLFIAVPLVALTVADTAYTYFNYHWFLSTEYVLPHSLYVTLTCAEIGFAVWAVWAAAIAVPSSRVVLIVLFLWTILGFLAWYAPGLAISNYAYLAILANCYFGVAVFTTWWDWRPFALTERTGGVPAKTPMVIARMLRSSSLRGGAPGGDQAP